MDAESARELIEFSEALKDSEMYSKSLEVLLVAIDRCSFLAPAYRCEVRTRLEKANMELVARGLIEDIFQNFKNALKLYPTNYNLYHDMGKYLFKYGFYREACGYFVRALLMNPNMVTTEKNLDSVKNMLMERWHFRMLNDKLRNHAYRLAIQEQMPAAKVLDVGTGTGLLAIFAQEAGACDIIACDGSAEMAEVAETILRLNKLADKIIVINKMSTVMDTGDLKGEASVLLTETFDAGLFGEHILQTLQHAWPALLADHATVIPNRAEFFVIGAQCKNLNQKYQLTPEAKKLLNLGEKQVHVLMPNETYDSEDVHSQKDLRYVTEPQSVLKVDFNDLNDIEMHLTRTKPYEVHLKVIEDGIVNITIGWFNLYLSDTITLTTDPRSESRANAWQQSVFFDELSRTVKIGDIIKHVFFMNGGQFLLNPSSNSTITRVSPDIIRFLNDEEYMKTISSSIPMASVYLGQMEDMPQIDIADLSPFPYFGFLMMKRGASSLLCCARTKQDKKFIQTVFKKNNIPLSKVTILRYSDCSEEDFGDRKYHALFAHFLELGGDIDIHLRDIGDKLKEKHLHMGGLCMPANVWVVGQLICSPWVDLNNRLDDSNLISKLKMEKIVNRYSVCMNYFVDFSTLEYTPLTEPVQTFLYPNTSSIQRSNVAVINDGVVDAILCSYEIELMQDLKVVHTNRPNSFVDGMLFISSRLPVVTSNLVYISHCKDEEGAIKLDWNIVAST